MSAVCDHGAPRSLCPTCIKAAVRRVGVDHGEADVEQRAAGLQTLLAAAHGKGTKDERARVIRIRDACFTGLVLTDELRAALARFDGMLLRGEDVSS